MAARVHATVLAMQRPLSRQARIVPADVIAAARKWVVLGEVGVTPLEFESSLWKAFAPYWHTLQLMEACMSH